MSDTPRTDAASVSRGFIEREMDYYSHQFVLAGNMRDLELELAAAKAEVERLRADAERYQWLRECARATSEHWGGRWSLVTEGPAPENATSAGIDAAIDAARNALKEPK